MCYRSMAKDKLHFAREQITSDCRFRETSKQQQNSTTLSISAETYIMQMQRDVMRRVKWRIWNVILFDIRRHFLAILLIML